MGKLDQLNDKQTTDNVSVNDFLSKKRREVVTPTSMQQLFVSKTIEVAKKSNTISEKKSNVQKRKKSPVIPDSIPEEQYHEENQIVKDELESVENIVIPEEVDVIETEYEINQAIEDIPQPIDLDDLEFVKIEKKTKNGYYKCKVSWKKDGIPDQLNAISSYVKKQSKGLISPRLCDLRVIANTNKTQLRNSKLKLGAITAVYKPDHTRLKVNKGTRFMISLPEDYESSGNILIYIQESRKKNIIELTQKDFRSEQHFNEFIGDRIAEYYIVGYDVAFEKLRLRTTNNPLMEIIDLVVKTNEYKAKPYIEDETHIYAVDIVSTSTKNQWLYLRIEESEFKGYYRIFARKVKDDSFVIQLGAATHNKFTISELNSNILEYLKKSYDRDWSAQLKIDDKHDSYYHYGTLLKYKFMKQALIEFEEIELDTDNTIGLNIIGIHTMKDHLKDGKKDVQAESILGETEKCKFVLSYLLLPMPSSDKREGRSYITSQEYYEKTGVKDRNKYQDRRNTILRKEGNQRFYNTGKYVFQIDYKIGEKNYKYIAKTFEEIKKNTGFLTDNIKTPKNDYPLTDW